MTPAPDNASVPLRATDCTLAEIRRGIPDDLRWEVAALFWEAFGPKIGLVPGVPKTPSGIVDVFSAVLCPTAGYVALDAAEVPLACAWVAPRGELLCAEPSELRRAFGPAVSWVFALSSLSPGTARDDETWQFEGFAARATCRGRGVGSELLARAIADARAAGARVLELTVADTNEGARRLYERFGFQVTGSRYPGPPQGSLFAFTRILVMELDLANGVGSLPVEDG